MNTLSPLCRRALLAVVILSFIGACAPQTSTAQSGSTTTRSTFAIGKYTITPDLRKEIIAMCPILSNEEHIEVTGHYDRIDFRERSAYNNFVLSVNRATEAIWETHTQCNIPLERFGSPHGTPHVGDPRDPEGVDSRTLTFRWAFQDEEDLAESETAYQNSLREYLEEWRGELSDSLKTGFTRIDENQIEMLALLQQIARDASYARRGYTYMKSDSLTVSVRTPPWFAGVGLRTSSKFGTGPYALLGRRFLDQNLWVYLDLFTEEQSHRRNLCERPSGCDTAHWGKWEQFSVALRYIFDDDDPVDPFLEGGMGLVHVTYDGPSTSIGWHHTGVNFLARAGLSARRGILGVEAVVGAEISKFAQSSVLREIADNNFHFSAQAGVHLTLHF